MMRHVSYILLLEWSTTSQRMWVYGVSVLYEQKDSRLKIAGGGKYLARGILVPHVGDKISELKIKCLVANVNNPKKKNCRSPENIFTCPPVTCRSPDPAL